MEFVGEAGFPNAKTRLFNKIECQRKMVRKPAGPPPFCSFFQIVSADRKTRLLHGNRTDGRYEW